MGCLKLQLQLQDYFQLVKNDLTKYCGAIFNTYTKYNQLESKSLDAPQSKTSVPPRQSKTSVPPRLSGGAGKNAPLQKDSLKGLSYSGNAGNLLLGTTTPISYVKYFYAPDSSMTAREVSGGKGNLPVVTFYEYDVKNQLTAVTDKQGNIIEQYSYDPAGNILKKTINGGTGNRPVVTQFTNETQTADPLGYPDGWNNLAYVNNGVTSAIDWVGGVTISSLWDALDHYTYGDGVAATIASSVISQSTSAAGYTSRINAVNTKLSNVFVDQNYCPALFNANFMSLVSSSI